MTLSNLYAERLHSFSSIIQFYINVNETSLKFCGNSHGNNTIPIVGRREARCYDLGGGAGLQ